MKAERGLSDFWRHDRSGDRVLELVSVLRGADSLIGNMGSDIGVTWSGLGVSYTDLRQRIVALDYSPLKDKECPFPGTAVDEVIGYAAHEGGHCLWTPPGGDSVIQREVHARWSGLPCSLQRDWQADQQAVLSELCNIQNVLEDAYVDNQVARQWPVLGEYIHLARGPLSEQFPRDVEAIALSGRLGRSAAVDMWLNMSLYGHPLPLQMPNSVKLVMESLLGLARRAAVEGVAEVRQRMAVVAADLLWREFPDRGPQPSLPQPENGDGREPDAATGGPASSSGPWGRRGVPVPKGLLVQVAEALGRGAEDLSRPVAHVLGEDARAVPATALRGSYDPELATRAGSQVRREGRQMQQAFRRQQDRNTRWQHGLDSGKLDDGRLWKALVGDTGYCKRRGASGEPSLAVGLLLDVSASMTGYMPIVQQTAALFCQGLMPVPGMNFSAWCYSGQSAGVTLTCVCDRGLGRLCLGGVARGGGTPSGAAIAGMKVLLERTPQRKKLLIHFTDGQPDSPVHVMKAVGACWAAGIHVCAVGLPQHQAMLSGQYGEGNYETIRAVPELPQAVSRIVIKLGLPQRRAEPGRDRLKPPLRETQVRGALWQ